VGYGGRTVILDLNAKRAARAAQRGGGMQMLLGEETFELVDELPIEIGELANEGKIGDAFRIMLRDPEADWARLRSCRPSFNDVMDVVEYFGTALGESVRSTETSATTGPHLKSTSTATTEETSLASVTHLTPANVSTPGDSSATSEDSHPSPPTDAS
jgi:hypothetical protein